MEKSSKDKIKDKSNIIWQPQPRQLEFMSRGEDEVFYGGSAGGGKSDSLINEALRQVDIPHYRALILRRVYPQLTTLIDRSKQIYPKVYPGAKYNSSSHTWTFPSGATIIFGHCQKENDWELYQGQNYDFIGFDELTHFLYKQYYMIKSRNRPNGSGTRVYNRSTGNPGGIGHGWVKERFITAGKPGETLWEKAEVINPNTLEKSTVWQSRVFIPSSVFDNQKLLENDPGYLSKLALLPEAERNAMLYGDWDSFEGQAFREFKNDSAHYKDRRYTHVIEPFKIPDNWIIYRGYDWGYSKPFSVTWFAFDTDGRMYHIREYYGCTQTPNTGIQLNPREVAKNIREIEQNDINLKGKNIIGIADPAIFSKSTSDESIASMMEQEYIYFNKGNNDRLAGKMQFHYRLKFYKNGIPMFYVFNNCKNFIRTIPELVYSSTQVEDIDTEGEDHIYDSTRYVMMENPITLEYQQYDTPPLDDPLNLYSNNKQYSSYNFYAN